MLRRLLHLILLLLIFGFLIGALRGGVPTLPLRGALLIGIVWSVQKLEETIEAEAWDVALDGFASPDGLDLKR